LKRSSKRDDKHMSQIFQSIIVRFIFSGSIATLVSLVVLYALVHFWNVWYLTATTVGFLAGFLLSFTLQKLWTFKDARRDATYWQLFAYFGVTLGALALNTALMFVLVDLFDFWYMVAQVFAVCVIAIVTFIIYGTLIFHRSKGHDKKHILIATGLYSPEVGGPATYSKLLEEELPRHTIGVVVLPFSSVRNLPRVFRHFLYFLLLIEKGYRADMLYALDPVSVGVPALLAARLLKKRFLLRVAGDYAWEQYCQRDKFTLEFLISNFQFPTVEEFQKKKFDFFTELQRKVEWFVARHAETIIVPSEYLKTIVIEWGVSREKIKVIYNTFDMVERQDTQESLRKKLGINGTVIVSAGRLVPWKGFSALIEVMAELTKEVPGIQLIIAGDGPDEHALKVKSIALQAPVIFTGRLLQSDLNDYVGAADVFVLNTGYEGFSHQLLEVMATGTPIVTTRIGGNAELIEDQKTGLLVTYNDKLAIQKAVVSLLQDDRLRGALTRHAKEKAKSFSKDRAINALLQVLTK